MAWKAGTKSRLQTVEYKTLADVIKLADELMEQYPEDLKSYADFAMEAKQDDYGDYYNPAIDYYTAKTEAELEAERKQIERSKSWEREQYERLKKKFEGS